MTNILEEAMSEFADELILRTLQEPLPGTEGIVSIFHSEPSPPVMTRQVLRQEARRKMRHPTDEEARRAVEGGR